MENLNDEIEHLQQRLHDIEGENTHLQTEVEQLRDGQIPNQTREDLRMLQEENTRLRGNHFQAQADIANELRELKETNSRLQDHIQNEASRHAMDQAFHLGKIDTLERHDRTNKYQVPYNKPAPFQDGENIQKWIKSFITFANATKIPDESRVDCMLTFLSPTAQIRVATLNLTAEDKHEASSCYEKVIRAIEGAVPKQELRTKLFFSKQKVGESMAEFTSKIQDLADRIYGQEKGEYKNQVLLDCFIAGIANDNIAIEIVKGEHTTMEGALKQALDLEGAYAIRAKTNPETQEHEIYRVEEVSRCQICKATNHQTEQCRQIICSFCNKRGHIFEVCRQRLQTNQTCGYCRRPGHTTAECRSKSSTNCFQCGKQGHWANECRVRQDGTYTPQNSGNSTNSNNCFNCGKPGHWTCKSEQNYNNPGPSNQANNSNDWSRQQNQCHNNWGQPINIDTNPNSNLN